MNISYPSVYLQLSPDGPLCILRLQVTGYNFQKILYFFLWRLISSKPTVQTLMKCRIVGHFISVFTVCWNTHFVLFDLILYIPVNNFSAMSGWVFLDWTSTEQGLMCLAQGYNAVMLEPANPWSRIKYSTTEPLHSYTCFGLSSPQIFCFACLSVVLHPSQQLWSCWDYDSLKGFMIRGLEKYKPL